MWSYRKKKEGRREEIDIRKLRISSPVLPRITLDVKIEGEEDMDVCLRETSQCVGEAHTVHGPTQSALFILVLLIENGDEGKERC